MQIAVDGGIALEAHLMRCSVDALGLIINPLEPQIGCMVQSLGLTLNLRV